MSTTRLRPVARLRSGALTGVLGSVLGAALAVPTAAASGAASVTRFAEPGPVNVAVATLAASTLGVPIYSGLSRKSRRPARAFPGWPSPPRSRRWR